MSDEEKVQNGVKIGNPDDPHRLSKRLERLRIALEDDTLTKEKIAELQEEHDGVRVRLQKVIDAATSALNPPKADEPVAAAGT